MSNIVHDKYHRQNHHSFMTPAVTDMGLDPIASKELPFSGEFVMDNADHDTWLLSSDRVAFEWVSGYNDVDSLKFDVGISGTNGKTITYPSGNFGNVVIADGNTDAPALSVVGKSIFTDDITHNGNLKVSSIDTTSISADTVLISGDGGGFALNVTNGLSKFNDVTGGNFNITGNAGVAGNIVVDGDAEVGGDLNVHENLYFTSGIANGGFLNVAGSAFFRDVKVSGKIEATDYYYERTTGINIPNDGGWKLSGTMSNDEKGLIPGKDAGAVTYSPGINNMTLSAIGLSSDSWASFGGNLLIHGDKFYVDADETTFSNPVYFSSTTAHNLSSTEFSAQNAHIEHICDSVQVDFLNSENILGESAYFDGVTGNIISGDMLSADDAFVNSLTTNTLTSDTLSAETALFDIVSATHVSGTYVIAESGFYLNENPIIIPGENQPGDILVSATDFSASRSMSLTQTPELFFIPYGGIDRRTNYDYKKPDDDKKRVMNIEYGNNSFVNLRWSTLQNVRHEKWAEGQSDITEYIKMYGKPYDTPPPGPDEHLHLNPIWQQWYVRASTRRYYTRVGNSKGQKKMRVICQIPDLWMKHSGGVELCFTFVCDVQNGNIWDVFVFQRLDANGNGMNKYMGLDQMYTPEGKKCTVSWMLGGASTVIRGLFRLHVAFGYYGYIECLGRGNNWNVL